MRHLLAGALALAALLCAPAMAQHAADSAAYAGKAPEQACVTWSGGAIGAGVLVPCPPGGKQETANLATANVAAAAQSVFGGTYILAQRCTSYGTLTLQALDADGTTYLTIVSKTAVDTSATASTIDFGGNATVRVTLTGTAGCSAYLSRRP